jgi:hypothetical protein
VAGNIIPFLPPTIDGYASKIHGAVTTRQGASFNDYDVRDLWTA